MAANNQQLPNPVLYDVSVDDVYRPTTVEMAANNQQLPSPVLYDVSVDDVYRPTTSPPRILNCSEQNILQSDHFVLDRGGHHIIVRCSGRPLQFCDRRRGVMINKWIAVPVDTNTANTLCNRHIGALATPFRGFRRVQDCGTYCGKLLVSFSDGTSTICCIIAPFGSRFAQGAATDVESKLDILESLRSLFDSGLPSSDSL